MGIIALTQVSNRIIRMYLLTEREGKMTGKYLAQVHACLWTETKSRSINTQKKNEAKYFPVLDRTTQSIKDLLYDLKHQKMIFDFAGPSENVRAGSIAPFCPLGYLISKRANLVHLARSRS